MTAFAVIAAIALFAFTSFTTGSIKGTVSPANSINSVMAVMGNDTIKAVIHDDSFDFVGIKAGTYKLVVEGVSGYKKTIKDGVVVEDGKVTDVGTITLQPTQ
jgi:hypothetical protein